MSTREINDVVRKFTPEMREIQDWLNQSIDRVKSWQDAPEGQPTPAELSAHKDQLLMTYARYRVVQAEIDVLVSYLRRMMNNQQSANESYRKGWEARLTHLFARLDEEEYRQLRHAIYAIAKEDEMPF
jgi:hypothetical protein